MADYVPPHDSHVFSDEGTEGCLLCGEWVYETLRSECPYEVIERAELARLRETAATYASV